MIKAVLFDYGGVLSQGGKSGSIKQIFAKIYGVDEANARLDPLSSKLLRGMVRTDKFFAELNRRHPGAARATKSLFVKHDADFAAKSEPVYALASELRKAGMKTGILSNVFAMSADELKKHGNYDGFDPLVLSCNEGTAKPDMQFYERALAKLKLPADEILFIDDQEKCLAPAQKLGMHTILAESPMQIVRDTKAMLKANNGLRL
jgi:epoxide hydrolase-like predicted phosphatase